MNIALAYRTRVIHHCRNRRFGWKPSNWHRHSLAVALTLFMTDAKASTRRDARSRSPSRQAPALLCAKLGAVYQSGRAFAINYQPLAKLGAVYQSGRAFAINYQ